MSTSVNWTNRAEVIARIVTHWTATFHFLFAFSVATGQQTTRVLDMLCVSDRWSHICHQSSELMPKLNAVQGHDPTCRYYIICWLIRAQQRLRDQHIISWNSPAWRGRSIQSSRPARVLHVFAHGTFQSGCRCGSVLCLCVFLPGGNEVRTQETVTLPFVLEVTSTVSRFLIYVWAMLSVSFTAVPSPLLRLVPPLILSPSSWLIHLHWRLGSWRERWSRPLRQPTESPWIYEGKAPLGLIFSLTRLLFSMPENLCLAKPHRVSASAGSAFFPNRISLTSVWECIHTLVRVVTSRWQKSFTLCVSPFLCVSLPGWRVRWAAFTCSPPTVADRGARGIRDTTLCEGGWACWTGWVKPIRCGCCWLSVKRRPVAFCSGSPLGWGAAVGIQDANVSYSIIA